VPKPKKTRYVMFPPQVVLFKPQGIPAFMLEQVILSVDEYESVRLIDHEGLDQEGAAAEMKVSRATCARILESAHRKIAEALSEGKAIRIEGGAFILGKNRYRCRSCGKVWDETYEGGGMHKRGEECPYCHSDRIIDLSDQIGWPPGGAGRGRGWQGGKGRRCDQV